MEDALSPATQEVAVDRVAVFRLDDLERNAAQVADLHPQVVERPRVAHVESHVIREGRIVGERAQAEALEPRHGALEILDDQ